MPGAKYKSIKKPAEYEALRAKNYSKQSAARISNADAKSKTHGPERGKAKKR